jgi:2-hydroxy-6-oxonona-2,4-dienedioate hydrolase
MQVRADNMAPLQYPLGAVGTVARVLQWGDRGPAAVFLHGLGSHAEVWSAVAPSLAKQGRRCLALDLPGHGLSSKGANFPYTLEGHVAWLSACVDAIDEDDVDLIASSLGGLWAAAFACRLPERVRSLTLIGAVGLEPLAEERRRATSNYLKRMDRDSVAGRLRRAVADPDVIEEHFIEEAFRMNNSPGAAAAFEALGNYYLEHINDDVQLEHLAAGAGRYRVLLIWGREDVIVPYATACTAAQRIPGSTLVTLDAVRHIPHLERPWAVNDALLRHFDHA